jgi:hypothetical protein
MAWDVKIDLEKIELHRSVPYDLSR